MPTISRDSSTLCERTYTAQQIQAALDSVPLELFSVHLRYGWTESMGQQDERFRVGQFVMRALDALSKQ